LSLRGRRPSCPTRTHEQRANGNGCEGTTVMRCNAALTTAQIQRHVQLDASIQARCFERCSLSDSLRASPSRLTQTAAADRRSRVWIGALDGFHIGGHTTDFTINGDGGKTRIGTGFVSTIYMGYFVCQVATEHFYPGVPVDQIPPIDPPHGSSDSKLIQIYPQVSKKTDWPPAPFTNGGPNGIAYLMQRWREGEKVSMVTKDGVVRLPDPIS